MKKKWWIIPVALLAAAAIAVGGWFWMQNNRQQQAAQQAVNAQQAAYAQYMAMVDHIEQTTLTVQENGKTIGTYQLQQLGLLETALEEVKNAFGQWDRTDPALFATLGAQSQIDWQNQAQRQTPVVTLDGGQMTVDAVLLDLSKEIRVAARDAYAKLEDGAYVIVEETPGTQLDSAAMEQTLRAAIDGVVIDETAPGMLSLDVADCGVYLPAQITKENGVFDYAALLEEDIRGVSIPVQLREHMQQLDVSALVSVDETGVLHADKAAIAATVAQWAEECRVEETPYILNSYAEGPVPLDFLLCSYELDQQTLTELLVQQVETLDDRQVEAPFFCTRNGQPFTIEGTYVEVDIDNQQMTYYQDGAVLVHTDVVSGYPWGHWTPTGLYAVQNKDVDVWLSGPDYTVFVKYWVGFNGPYGIHDASWRTEFGGKKYLSNGSHGCVNTPEEAMRQIHEAIAVGTSVVVHDVKDQ